MGNRRAESAGTFNIASEMLKPRISHSREPRLSKMQRMPRLKGFISTTISMHSPQKVDISLYTFLNKVDADGRPCLVEAAFSDPFSPLIKLPWQTVVFESHNHRWDILLKLKHTAIILHLAHTGVQQIAYGVLGKKCRRRGVICQYSLYRANTCYYTCN